MSEPGVAGDRSRLWWTIAAVVTVAAIASGIAVAITGAGDSKTPSPPRQSIVEPIPRGADAQQQARNIAAWLRARASARP